jgi:hypothetical protein
MLVSPQARDSGCLPKTWRKSLPSLGTHGLKKVGGLGQTMAKHMSKEHE